MLKKSGGHLPRVELEEMGPSFDFEMRRSQLASAGDFKKACRQPKANKVLIIKHGSCQNQNPGIANGIFMHPMKTVSIDSMKPFSMSMLTFHGKFMA